MIIFKKCPDLNKARSSFCCLSKWTGDRPQTLWLADQNARWLEHQLLFSPPRRVVKTTKDNKGLSQTVECCECQGSSVWRYVFVANKLTLFYPAATFLAPWHTMTMVYTQPSMSLKTSEDHLKTHLLRCLGRSRHVAFNWAYGQKTSDLSCLCSESVYYSAWLYFPGFCGFCIWSRRLATNIIWKLLHT